MAVDAVKNLAPLQQSTYNIGTFKSYFNLLKFVEIVLYLDFSIEHFSFQELQRTLI